LCINPKGRIKLEFILKWVDKKDLITIDDYNFDGYNDIGIVHSIGYGGDQDFYLQITLIDY